MEPNIERTADASKKAIAGLFWLIWFSLSVQGLVKSVRIENILQSMVWLKDVSSSINILDWPHQSNETVSARPE